jgi:nitroreductase
MMLTASEIAGLCEAGAMAPSGGNAQPWQVVVAGGRLRIGLDPQRSDRS